MNASLHDLVYDGGRFSAFYSSSISEGSVSIWAALSFAPKRNRLFTLFHRPELPTVVGGYLQQWSPALRLFQKDVTVHSLAFSPDGTKIVSSGVVKGTRDVGYALIPDEKFVLRIWDVKTGTEAIPAPLLDGPSIVAFAPDTTEVWAASANGTIYKVDATTGNLNLEHQISNRTKPSPQSDDTAGHLIDVGIAPSGSDLDLNSPQQEQEESETATERASYPDFESDMTFQVQPASQEESGAYSQTTVEHTASLEPDVYTPSPYQDDQGAEANPRSDAADFNLFAHGMLVPPASNLPLRPTIDSITFSRENFATAAFSHNGLWVVLDEQTYGRLWILSLEALKSPYAPLTPPTSQSWPIRRETYGHTPHSLDFSPDSSIFASGTAAGGICLWDVASGNRLRELYGHISAVTLVKCIDCTTLLSSAADGRIITWDLREEVARWSTTETVNNFEPLAFSSNNTKLIAGLADGTIRILETSTGKAHGPDLIDHFNPASAAAFSCDGESSQLVSAAPLDSIHVWDTRESSDYVWKSPRHHRPPHRVSFFAGGSRVISWRDYDPTETKVWSTGSGKELIMNPYDDEARPDTAGSSLLSSFGLPIDLLPGDDDESLSSLDHTSQLETVPQESLFNLQFNPYKQIFEDLSLGLEFDISTGVLSRGGQMVWKLPKELEARACAICRNYLALGLWNGRVIVVHFPEEMLASA